MQVDSLIHARWIIPVEPANQTLVHHSLAIDQGRIQAIVPTAEARSQYQAKHVVELPDHLVLPGLINAHTHSPMCLFRGLADDLPLMPWLQDHIWPAEARWVDEAFVADGSQLAIAEMLRSGTTCFNDMYFFPDITAQAAMDLGIRCVVGLILLNAPTIWAADADAYLAKARAVHSAVQNQALVSTCLAPHAPYTVSDQLLRSAMADPQLPNRWHMHIHETADEIQQGIANEGIRPLQRLHQLGLINDQLIAVHMTQLSATEIEQIAAANSSVVHCPESNLKLAAGACPVQHLLHAGVNVALGTDGAASNNDLDMLGEMRTAALFGKQVAQDARAVSAEHVLQMATINGARALGLDHEIGSLLPGKAADMLAVNLSDVACQPVYHPLSQLVYSATRHQVSDVWIAGQQRVANGELVDWDGTDLMTRVHHWRDRIAAHSGE